MLVAMWLWKSANEGAAKQAIAYSQLFEWARAGKVASVDIAGDGVDATLKAPETLEGRPIRDLPQQPAPRRRGVLAAAS